VARARDVVTSGGSAAAASDGSRRQTMGITICRDFPSILTFFNQFLINEPDQFYFSHLTLLSVSLVDTAYEGVTSCDTTQEADAWSDGDAASRRC
jgi:hypothetical protein